MVVIIKSSRIVDLASRIRLPSCFELTISWANGNDVVFLLSSLVSGASFMSISLPVLQL